jgi:hypothetical protein
MGLSSEVKEIHQSKLFVAHDIPATHGAGAYNAFAITGGPVWIKAILEYNDTLIAGATTTAITVGAVAMQVGAVAINGAANTMVVSPLDAAIAKIAPALAVQMPSLLGYATNDGVVASPGVNITVTFAGVAMGALENVSYYVVYYKLAPNSLIA